jgi:hypothetical protein
MLGRLAAAKASARRETRIADVRINIIKINNKLHLCGIINPNHDQAMVPEASSMPTKDEIHEKQPSSKGLLSSIPCTWQSLRSQS